MPLYPNTHFKWVFMDIIPAIASIFFTKYTTFANYLLIVVAYSKLPILFGMESITAEEVMYKLDMFQAIFIKVDEFGWWHLERIQTDTVMQFISREFQEGLSVHGVCLTLAALEYKDING